MASAIALGLLWLLVSVTASKSETLVCVQEAAGGLKFVNGQWQGVMFKNSGYQYMVTSGSTDPLSYEVTEIGKDSTLFQCTRMKFQNGTISEQMFCGGLGYGMVINFAKLRYVEVYSLGYIDDDRSGQNTPSIGGGKCSTIRP